MNIPPCPRCRGRVYWDDLDRQWACLHCGWRWYPKPLPRTPASELEGKRKRMPDRAGKSTPR